MNSETGVTHLSIGAVINDQDLANLINTLRLCGKNSLEIKDILVGKLHVQERRVNNYLIASSNLSDQVKG